MRSVVEGDRGAGEWMEPKTRAFYQGQRNSRDPGYQPASLLAKFALWALFALLFVADLNADWLGAGIWLLALGSIGGNAHTASILFRACLWALAALIAHTSPAAPTRLD